MWEARRAFILSDWHLAAQDTQMFQATEELCECLEWICAHEPGALFVIAGDMLDFLVPGEDKKMIADFDPVHAKRLTEEIVRLHSKIFERLSQISQKHKLVIESGNHDYELILPEVQDVIQDQIKGPIRWLVHGEAAKIQIANALVVVEHGNLYDESNRIHHEDLLKAVDWYSRGLDEDKDYSAPLGTCLVKNHIHGLRNKLPRVELVKPEVAAVLTILWPHLTFSEKVKWLDMLRPMVNTAWNYLMKRMKAGIDTRNLCCSKERSSTDLQEFLDEKESSLQTGTGSAHSILDSELEEKIEEGLRQIAKKDTSFDLKAHDGNKKYAEYLFYYHADEPNNVNIFVTGHTHIPKAHVLGDDQLHQGLYLNVGSWVRTEPLPQNISKEEWGQFVKNVLTNGQGRYCPYTMAVLENTGDIVHASLHAWERDRHEPVSVWERGTKNNLCWKEFRE